MSTQPRGRGSAHPSRGAGRGQRTAVQGRTNVTTPPPAWPDSLSLKEGDVVRLKTSGPSMLPEFPEGELVIITSYRSTRSPSYPTPADHTPDDSDTIYGFKKRVPAERITYHSGLAVGDQGAPKYQDISLGPELASTGDDKIVYRSGDKVYLQKQINITRRDNVTGRRVLFEAKKGTRCFIAAQTTRNDSRSTATKTHSVYSLANSYYVIQVKLSTPYWRDVECGIRMQASNFDTVLSAEARSHFSDQNLLHRGIPTVVSVSDTEIYHPNATIN